MSHWTIPIFVTTQERERDRQDQYTSAPEKDITQVHNCNEPSGVYAFVHGSSRPGMYVLYHNAFVMKMTIECTVLTSPNLRFNSTL